MPAERAGYTVTMFCIDVSPSMAKLRSVEVSDGRDGESRVVEMSNLAWSLQYVLLKIQEMIFHGRKTEQCGVTLFGTEETNNVINESNDGYEHVSEFIPIAQPNAGTLAKLQALQPSTEIGDPVDAIIVAVETQDRYLLKKKSWTRKLVVLTDGENPMEIEHWELTVNKINNLSIATTIVGIDFDDEEFGFKEEDKTVVKYENEKFFHRFVSSLKDDLGMIGTAAYALLECRRPDVKVTKSALMGTILRLGDIDIRPDEAVELPVKMSKCTAVVRPASMKKFARRIISETGEEQATQNVDADNDERRTDVYAQLGMQTEYLVSTGNYEEQDRLKGDADETTAEKVDKDQLIKGFKYGASYAPCPEGQFPRLSTRKGMDICGFFPDHLIRRELAMSEVQYVWADPSSGEAQVAFSSIVQAMLARKVVAIARWVSRDDMDPKMGLLVPRELEKIGCFLWMQMPFADDVRRYTFPSLDNLMSKKGELITKHPFIPTNDQMEAIENFVDAMDLMHAGDKDDAGLKRERMPWFDPRLSYNPAVHSIKQALFHAAIVTDLHSNPLPPPHEEIVKYLKPPRRVLKRAHSVVEECKKTFKIKQVPKRLVRQRKDGHVRADDDDDELLLLDKPIMRISPKSASQRQIKEETGHNTDRNSRLVAEMADQMAADSETEPESDEEATAMSGNSDNAVQLPTPQSSIANASESRSQITNFDEGREAGRIIGIAHPLEDFKKSVEGGNLAGKAMAELISVLKDILSKPFARRRHEEMLACMQEMRSTCLKEGHINTWNLFLRALKEDCLSSTRVNNIPFWKKISDIGIKLSLIGESEASESYRSSNVSDDEAEKFLKA